MFRETFIYQVIVFLDCLKNPIKDQVESFKIESVENQYLDILQQRAYLLLKPNKKRTFDQSLELKNTMLREQIWSKSKNLINKKPSFEGRDSKFDLTNFEIEAETSKFSAKREKKAFSKRGLLVKPVC